jgi:hypothetical protein
MISAQFCIKQINSYLIIFVFHPKALKNQQLNNMENLTEMLPKMSINQSIYINPKYQGSKNY